MAYNVFPIAWTVPYMKGICVFSDNYFLSIEYGFEFSIFISTLPILLFITFIHWIMLKSMLVYKIQIQYNVKPYVNTIKLNILAYIAFLCVGIFIYIIY